MMKVEIKEVKISEIKLNQDNPRRISKQDMDRLVKSLNEFPDMLNIREIVVDETMTILGGNMRYLALKKSGAKAATAKIVTGLTKEQKREFVIKDNSNFGEYDFDALANGWSDLPLADWGVDLPEDWLGGDKSEPADAEPQIDRAEELLDTWKVKENDLYLIGEHKLLCADCTKLNNLKTIIGTEIYDLLADPPYNIGFHYDKIGDNLSDKQYNEFCLQWFETCASKAVGSIITPGPQNERTYQQPRDKGIWIKRNATAGASVFHLRCAEPILFYGKFKEKRNTDIFDYSSGFTAELKAAQRAAGVLEKHPPAKSMNLWMELAAMLGDIILDPFGGNGTTLLACENLHKKCRMIEISPAYCAVILQRMTDAFPGIEIKKVK